MVQFAYVVQDLDTSVDTWIRAQGSGPFFLQRNLRVPVTYRGADSFIDIDVALGQAGCVQIELIHIAGAQPSVYREMYPDGGSGFHHIARFSAGYDEEIARLCAEGAEVGCSGSFNGCRFAYVDTRSTVGFFTELYEEGESMRAFYRNIAAASDVWNGERPVRPWSEILP